MREPLNFKEQEMVKVLYAEGRTYHAIAKQLNRSPHTIKKFLTSSQEVVEHVEQIKQELSGIFEEMARRMLDSISPEDIQKINAYQRTISAGVCTDKARLLRGESTSNIASLSQIAISLEEKTRGRLICIEEGNATEGEVAD